MTRGKLLVAVTVAAWAFGTTPAWAQRERGDAPATGSAVDRGSSGSSSSSPSSGGGGSPSSGGSSSTSSSTGAESSGGRAYTPSAGSDGGGGRYVGAPVRPSRSDEDAAQGRTSGGGGGRRPSADAGDRGSSRAVPRGSDVSGAPSSGSRTANASNGDPDPSRRAVPTYSRPRDGRPVTGTAVDRPAGYYGGGGNGVYYPIYPSYPYYPSYYYPSYGFGLGFYDFGWYDPYYYGGYYPGAFGGGYYGGGYQGGGYASGTSSYGRGPTGSLRLKIKPRDAQVYIDGYLVGVVDDFDGMFQKLGIDAGGHKVEIKADGHEPISLDVLITPGETVTYKGELPRK